MKLTKYPQSCLMIESLGKNILIDPGDLSYKESYKDQWEKADIVLITHKHSDHCNAEVLKEFSCPIYSTKEVAMAYTEFKIRVVQEGGAFNLDKTDLDQIEIKVVKAQHGYLPHLTQSNAEINEAIGFLINDGEKTIYIAGDTISFKNDYKCDIFFASVSGCGLVMSPFEAACQAKENGGLIIPCHMDNPKYPVDVNAMERIFKEQNVRYKILENEEIIEI